jgi:Spy/CpxP family protein refolding chaperone
MKANWTLWVALLALGLAVGAMTSHAQGRPDGSGPVPEAQAGGVEQDFGMPGGDGMGLEEEGGHGPGGGDTMGMGRNPELQKKLNLSDDQRTKLADIHDRQTRAAIPIRSDLEIAGLDMRKLMRADKPDQKAIDAQIDKMAGLRARLQKSRVASMLEARAVLTPAQQKTLRESRPGMGRGMHGRRGMHGDLGGPGARM